MLQNYRNDLLAFAAMVVLAFAYVLPSLNGKVLFQSDLENAKNAAQQSKTIKEKEGDYPFWTNSMFGGMPTYMIASPDRGNLFVHPYRFIFYGINNPAMLILVSMLGMFFLLRVFQINTWLALAGSVFFAFGTYNLIILEVGHVTKLGTLAIGLFMLASCKLIWDGRYWLGGALFALFFNLNVMSYHAQVTYYLGLLIAVWGIFEVIQKIQSKQTATLPKPILTFAIAVVLGLLPNVTFFLMTKEYTPTTMRGGSELSSKKEAGKGLDTDYALEWSYGKLETMTLLFPHFMGGSSRGEVDKNSEVGKLLKANGYNDRKLKEASMPYYWGNQLFTEGPFYFGVMICFLFLLGMWILDPKYRWWLLAGTLLSFCMAWGKNLMFFAEPMLRFFPAYNKFRGVNLALCVASITMPLGAMLTLQKLLSNNNADFEKFKKAALGFGAFILFVIALGPSFISEGKNDSQLQAPLLEALNADRASMLRFDALRTLFFFIVSAGLILMYVKSKIQQPVFYIALISIAVLDMWSYGKKHLDYSDFISKKEEKEKTQPYPFEEEILKDKDGSFRVINLSTNFTTDSRTSYFFNNVGGYHGSKSARYQDLISEQLYKNNRQVLNMLNTRYIIGGDKGAMPRAQRNPEALGNAWFVNEVQYVNSPDEEMRGLDEPAFNAKNKAVVNQIYKSNLGIISYADSNATIRLTQYKNDHLVYESNSQTEGIAVFSENYYPQGWTAKIDGKETPIAEANYVLRALKVPAGKHTITFDFYPPSFAKGRPISMAGSILVLLALVGGVFMDRKKMLPAKN